MSVTIDIICSALNAARFLPELLDSIERQTYTDWRLWLRDDGSTDGSVEIMRQREAVDSRVRVLHVGGPKSGPAAAFGWLLERVPPDSRYVMLADADDVWLPHKIERTLAAMQAAERESPPKTPILVHTDLIVVDERLGVIHPSFWEYTRCPPEPATLRRQIVRTLMTGPTLMLNAALRESIGSTPTAARIQDTWFGLVAVALGKVVALRESTVLYRQHGSNTVGAREARITPFNFAATVRRGMERRDKFREGVAHSAALSRALLDGYGSRLSNADRAYLSGFAELPNRPFLSRKLGLMRYRALPEFGLLRAIGVVLRG